MANDAELAGTEPPISRDAAWAGIYELWSRLDVNSRVTDIHPEAMIAAYTAMIRVNTQQSSDHRDRACPCISRSCLSL